MWDRGVEKLLEPHDRRDALKLGAAGVLTGLAGCSGGNSGSSGGGQNGGSGNGAGTDPQINGTAGSGSGEGTPDDGGTSSPEETSSNGSGNSGSSDHKEFPLPDSPSNPDLLRAHYVVDDKVNPDVEIPGWSDRIESQGGLVHKKQYEKAGGEAKSISGQFLEALGLWDRVSLYANLRSQPDLIKIEGGVPDLGSVEEGPELTEDENIQGYTTYRGTFQGNKGERRGIIAHGKNWMVVHRDLGESSYADLRQAVEYQINQIVNEENDYIEANPELKQAVKDSKSYEAVGLSDLGSHGFDVAFTNVKNGEIKTEEWNYLLEDGEVQKSKVQ